MTTEMRTLGGRVSPSTAIGLVLFGLSLGVYISGLPPSITWSNAAADSGDLASAVNSLGVPHPPGYPTYVFLGKLFTFLPFGDTAFRLNIMSAVTGAVAVAATFYAGLFLVRLAAPEGPAFAAGDGEADESSGDRPHGSPAEYLPAVVGALALAFSPIFWSQAIVTEVYSLNALFAAVIAAIALSWLWELRVGRPPSMGKPVLISFIFGVGMGNHLTLAAVAVPLLLLIALRVPSRRFKTWGSMALGALVGLGVYAYLPIAAAGTPPVNWGGADSWSGFFWVVTGGFYRDFVFGLPFAEWDDRLVAWADVMLDHFAPGLVAALAGAWLLWRRDRLLAGALGLTFLSVSAYATFYETGDSLVFLIPALLMVALWISLGVRSIVDEIAVPLITGSRFVRYAPWTLGVFALVMVLAVPGLSALRNYPVSGGFRLDLSGDRSATDYGEAAFRAVEPDAVIMALGDNDIFSLWYQSFVVEEDSEVVVVVQNFLQFDWYVEDLRSLHPGLLPEGLSEEFDEAVKAVVNEHLGRRPVYLTFDDAFPAPEYDLRKEGEVFRVLAKKDQEAGA